MSVGDNIRRGMTPEKLVASVIKGGIEQIKGHLRGHSIVFER